jgi:hypothetical protein
VDNDYVLSAPEWTMLLPELYDTGRRNLADPRQLHQVIGGCRIDVYAALILIRR